MVVRSKLWHKPRNDGKHNIKLYLYAHGETKFISTKYFVCKKDWDEKKMLVKDSNPNSAHINAAIKGEILDLEKKVLITPNVRVNKIKEDKSILNFDDFLQKFYDSIDKTTKLTQKGQSLSKGSRTGMKTHLNRIIEYTKIDKIDFDDIDNDFYGRFVNYLRHQYKHKINKQEIVGLAENSISKTISNFVRVVKEAWKQKMHDNRQALYFSVPRVESEKIALTEKEINKIMAIKNIPKHLELERDRFYVAYNFFLRFEDSIIVDKSDIIEMEGQKYLKAVSGKTKINVVIPIFPKTLEILEKYNYKFPKTTNQESNWKIKDIGKLAEINELTTTTQIRKGEIVKTVSEKYKLITTHTTRRSMATNLYLNGFELKDIQLMGGWKTLDMLETYLKIDKMENAMKAAKHPFFANRK